eukprot:TRINITY_DN24613_c0_g1_i1.p1 TRINITY_DN24613_c0_g1~~TRINITY_DN24613_c0_g1_i1.p1  ORF type:complete len:270 (+),score=41.23 TRINITY_DN24613_c0_g1_i1:241-1050(+)
MLPLLTHEYQIFCLDLPGMSLSSREETSFESTEECIAYFVNSIEKWRHKTQLDMFYLAGHSFGALIAGYYASRYPERVKALALISPVGVSKDPLFSEEHLTQRLKYPRCLAKAYSWASGLVWRRKITPFSMTRKFKCLGRPIVTYQFRKMMAFSPREEADRISDYFYKSLQLPRGTEEAVFWIFKEGGQPKYPLEQLIKDTLKMMPIAFYFGDKDFIDTEAARNLVHSDGSRCEIKTIANAGHQINTDNPIDLSSELVQFFKSTKLLAN